jgi:hypothetical protein
MPRRRKQGPEQTPDTERRRRPEYVDPRSEEEIRLSELPPAGANFAARVALRKTIEQQRTDARQKQEDTARNIIEARRDHLHELVGVAQTVALQASTDGVEPEFEPCHSRIKSKEIRKWRLQSPRKYTGQEEEGFGQSWLLARKPVSLNKRMLMQEAALGVDGKIRVYMRDDIPNSAGLLRRPSYARGEIINAVDQVIHTPWDTVSVAGDAKGVPMIKEIDSGHDYPFFKFAEPKDDAMRSLTPEDIQRGLEDFVVEHGLTPPPAP